MVSNERLKELANEHMGAGGLYVYDLDEMSATAQGLMAGEMPHGLTVRYAVKANPYTDVVRRFDEEGLHFDASSIDEAIDLIWEDDVHPHKISLSSQVLNSRQMAELGYLLETGIKPVATSLHQIKVLGKVGTELGLDAIAVRMNPDEGSGANNRTTVGGPASGFGIWKDYWPDVLKTADDMGLKIDRIHTHIGSGVNPNVWRKAIKNSLKILEHFPDATTLDMGGGYKVARTEDEEATDMDEVYGIFADELTKFEDSTGRKIHLEIEPGTLLVANAGVLLGRVEDTASTSKYEFLRLNIGMAANLRPSHYGAQHPIESLEDSEEEVEYVGIGPGCESGDVLTVVRDNPEYIKPVLLKKIGIGGFLVLRGAGAYGLKMAARDYNNVPSATELAISESSRA